ETGSWRPGDSGPPTAETALSQNKIPLEVEEHTLTWEGPDPAFNVLMLERVINELELYLQNDFVSEHQVQMEIFEQELQPITEQFDGVWEQFWALDKVNLANLEILGEYTRLKSRISDLRSKDALSRKFEVVNDPIALAAPISPKTNLMTTLTFVASSMLSFFWFSSSMHSAHMVKRMIHAICNNHKPLWLEKLF
ncbi:MAG: hypothetical protein ACLFQG_08920, partial [Desulfovermiculus sp.]